MKNILAFIGLLAVLGIGAYWYLSRPVANPNTLPNDTVLTAEDGTRYQINQEKSSVSFEINEVLRNEPFTAVGTTNAVFGDVAFDGKNLAFGKIQVNARSLKTDDTRRDGALARLILKSEKDENEFIVFTPTGLNRVPRTIPSNTPFEFSLLGDMTISGVTQPASFNVTMIITGTTVSVEFSGSVLRSDFSLTVPSLPFLASVDDTVVIKGSVVANRVE
jgi:polyisoprenoid-binding protein YceI